MKLFWLKTRVSWIASISEFEHVAHGKIIKYVKPEVRKLCVHLLDIGGKRVAIPINDDPGFFEALVEIGQVTTFKKLQIKKSVDGECHSNSASLWSQNRKKYTLVTGFGLSDDHIWRRHSWLITLTGNLIETTIPREVYYGIPLSEKGAAMFAEIYIE